MPSAIRTVAVVLAGGSGMRVGLDTPKQLLKVAGRTVIEHTVGALHDCPEIDEIIVMMAPEHIADAERLLLTRPPWPKVTRILPGGADRNATTRAALDALGPDECNVLFHDAVRPLVSRRIVADCVHALDRYEAVDVAVASPDTIIRVGTGATEDAAQDAAQDEVIDDIPDRSLLRRGQTPQAFRLSTIRRAYAAAVEDPTFRASDDCGVVLRYLPDVAIHVVAGDEQNMKVTYPIDLYLLDRLFQLQSHTTATRTDADLRAALHGRTVVVFGGSYGIGARVCELAERAGARAFPLSRSSTGTHLERPETIRAALAGIAAETSRIDAVVVTAAQLSTGPLTALDDEQVLDQVRINYLGPVAVARACEPYLARTAGQLVLFTSSSYTRGRADYALYSSTKAAVVNLAQALADEWAPAGVRVNVVNPERTATPMRLTAFGAEPEGTLLDADTVAATVVDVLASTTTGQVFDVRLDR